MRERNQFTQAFLSHLSERPSNLMSSEDGAPATGSTEMLDGYLDLQRWAQEYLRRIGQGQAGDIIAVVRFSHSDLCAQLGLMVLIAVRDHV